MFVYKIVGNEDRPNLQTRATIVKGDIDALGRRTWSIVAQTVDYPKSNTAFDHRFRDIVVSPAGESIYVSSGSRTDHGEPQSAGGLYPNMREVGLTAIILRLPAHGQNIVLPNDRIALKRAGYVFAEGTRSTVDMAFAPNNELFGLEHSPSRDTPDELNWLRAGQYYGFPWWIGGQDNPQQFSNYAPADDRLLDARFVAVESGLYSNDPEFPQRPIVTFNEPIANLGPHADNYRDPSDGKLKDASTTKSSISTFTPHSFPVGLVFDTAGILDGEFNRAGFMLSWSTSDSVGNNVAGSFHDPGQDLVHLALTRTADRSYTVRATRIVGGFSNPIDAELIGNNIYILEYGGSGGLWEVGIPSANLLQNSSFEWAELGWLSPWTLRADIGGAVAQDPDTKAHGNYAVRVDIPVEAPEPWLVQLRQKGLLLQAKRNYTISFWAKASAPRAIEINLQQPFQPYTVYLRKSLSLTPAWQQYRLNYRAAATEPALSLNFNLAGARGQVWLDEVLVSEDG